MLIEDIHMNFLEMYEKCITVKKYTSVVYDPDILIPNLYSYDQLPVSRTELDAFLHLLAGGNLFCEDLFAFSFQPMDCCLLLYTTAGSGTLTIKDRTVSLTEKQLLFFDCNQPFSLQGAILPWSFKLFFISGEPLHLFRRLFHAHTAPCFALSDFSPLPDEIKGAARNLHRCSHDGFAPDAVAYQSDSDHAVSFRPAGHTSHLQKHSFLPGGNEGFL